MVKNKGHCPNMLLWMIDEYFYIMGHLRPEDCDSHVMLGHELLLLMQSHCYKKWGGGRHCCSSMQVADNLSSYWSDTLDHVTWAFNDSMALECLAWAVYDNIRVPQLTSLESFDQIIECLVEKAYEGLHVWHSAHTSAVFKREEQLERSTLWSMVTILLGSTGHRMDTTLHPHRKTHQVSLGSITSVLHMERHWEATKVSYVISDTHSNGWRSSNAPTLMMIWPFGQP